MSTGSGTWDGSDGLVTPDGRVVDPGPAYERALAAHDPSILLDWLREQGIDAELSDEDLAWFASEPARVLAAATPVLGDGVRSVVVLTTGILLRHPRPRDRFAVFGSVHGAGRRLLRRLQEVPATELVHGDPDDVWLPWEEITRVSVEQRVLRASPVRVTTRTGAVHAFEYRSHTEDAGNSLLVMEHYLGDRFAG